MVRHNNQLPTNLPQLQNLIKRDPASYVEEFNQQYKYFLSSLDVFKLQPDGPGKGVDSLVMFIASVAHCYPKELVDFPQILIDLLKTHHVVLNPELRLSFCKALLLIRSKNLLSPIDLLPLFFMLLRCNDKNLRKYLESNIITDIKNINAKHKNVKLNTSLQNFMFTMLKDNNSKAAKMSIGIMIELYKKKVWNDAKTVNVIATAFFSKINKVLVAALKFFMGTDDEEKDKDSDDSDSDNDIDPKDVMMANKVNKKTRKREKLLIKVKKAVKKKKKKSGNEISFSALHLLHDPQGVAERLFKRIESSNERFEIKVMILNVISKLVGAHQLILLNFYPYLQRYMQPHQKEVTKLLLYAAQASHELVPPDAIQPLLTTIVNNFVTERNSSDVIAIGLNAVRETCARCPLAMTEDLLRDLAEFKNYRDRSVMMAARALIHLYRHSLPKMLHKRDRGRPTEAMVNLKGKQYGELDGQDHVPGAEVLAEDDGDDMVNIPDESESEGDSDGSWVDIDQSDGEQESTADTSQPESEVNQEKKEIALQQSMGRLLSDEDFKKIDTALLQKQVNAARRGKKRPYEDDAKKDTVQLKDIENIYKKRKQSKEERIQSVRTGQEGREKFGFKDRRVNPLSSKTNREKKKNKAYSMIRHKVRGKVKRSFKEKQIALRNHLLKQKKK